MRPEGLQALTEGVRRFVSRRGDGLITYTEGGAVFWRSRGIPPGRVVSYNNTVDVEEIRRAASRIPEERLRESRRQFGLEGKNVLLFSGRLYPEKRVDLLLEAMAILRRTRPGVGLLILGDGPERKFLENSVSRLKLQDIHFIGECVRPEESGIYFRLADLLVIPGLVGLAVVHGFALGLPLVTTKHDYHSPEIEYLSDENGLMTSHDPSAYADGIRRLLASPERLTAMREAAGRQGDGLRLSASAERFVDGINSLCEQDP
jgi:glycosyltransferase involved in cell wall biosynthesis